LTLALPFPLPRFTNAVGVQLRWLRAHPILNAVAWEEAWRERVGHPVDATEGPHLRAALEWLTRAQDAAGDGGFARAYSLAGNPCFRSRGWHPGCPETTGCIIPNLYQAARHLQHPDLAIRAERAARWEAEIQLPSGGVRSGVGDGRRVPAVFGTGQVLFGWLAAFAATGSGVFAGAARRAGCFLLRTLDEDACNTQVAWGLAEAGRRLGAPEFTAAAARNLRAVTRLQHTDGWLPRCCPTDPMRPLLHTIAYAIRGLLEGGRLLQDARLIAHAARAAERIAGAVGPDGRLAGRFTAGWRSAVPWSCLSGQAQMANIWLRLFVVTRERKWLEPVGPVLHFLKSTQNRTSRDPGLRGGVKGSFPLGAEHGPYQTLNTATKFFVDALIRHERITGGGARDAETATAATLA